MQILVALLTLLWILREGVDLIRWGFPQTVQNTVVCGMPRDSMAFVTNGYHETAEELVRFEKEYGAHTCILFTGTIQWRKSHDITQLFPTGGWHYVKMRVISVETPGQEELHRVTAWTNRDYPLMFRWTYDDPH